MGMKRRVNPVAPRRRPAASSTAHQKNKRRRFLRLKDLRDRKERLRGEKIRKARKTRMAHERRLAEPLELDIERQLRNAKRSESRWRRAAIAARKELAANTQDTHDLIKATHTRFSRCACGRMKEMGIRCPTNQEGGDCEAGR